MSLREEQCKKVCRILDNVLANRPTERDSLIVATRNAFSALSEPHWIPVTKDTPKEADTYMCTCSDAGRLIVTLVKWQQRTKTWNLTGARAYWKVIAWCERPEPYKGVTT